MKFNKEKLKKTVFYNATNEDLILFLKSKMTYFEYHNKNLTKTQFYIIEDLNIIIQALEA